MKLKIEQLSEDGCLYALRILRDFNRPDLVLKDVGKRVASNAAVDPLPAFMVAAFYEGYRRGLFNELRIVVPSGATKYQYAVNLKVTMCMLAFLGCSYDQLTYQMRRKENGILWDVERYQEHGEHNVRRILVTLRPKVLMQLQKFQGPTGTFVRPGEHHGPGKGVRCCAPGIWCCNSLRDPRTPWYRKHRPIPEILDFSLKPLEVVDPGWKVVVDDEGYVTPECRASFRHLITQLLEDILQSVAPWIKSKVILHSIAEFCGDLVLDKPMAPSLLPGVAGYELFKRTMVFFNHFDVVRRQLVWAWMRNYFPGLVFPAFHQDWGLLHLETTKTLRTLDRLNIYCAQQVELLHVRMSKLEIRHPGKVDAWKRDPVKILRLLRCRYTIMARPSEHDLEQVVKIEKDTA